ncbi:MAG: hypothetical protein JWN17_869 [Frankiales bacterium]|nr:hypothetical protein [Frankiales bacterium]
MPADVALRRVAALLAVLAVAALPGCSHDAGRSAAQDPTTSAAPPPTTSVTLPPDPLLALVPTPSEVPAGLVPVVAGSGPRDLAAVAGFSGDPAAAAAALRAHGFAGAYVAQYAEPTAAGASGRVLSVVVSRFGTLKGAADDLAGDVAAGGGPGTTPDVGQAASLRTQPLPGAARGRLTTLRFRVGTRTFLLALGAPAADEDTVVRLGRLLAARATPA